MKTLALVPVFNEATNILEVLEELEDFVDDIILVNDGSWDESEKVIKEWMADG
ncbi:MAG: glycosyltransferase, partial [Actinomycetia bacterium]|nr:glycosyltransferase [Actinomycetes bacterium]